MALLPTSDLSNPNTFPTYFNLPPEYEVNDTCYTSTKPRKHWCFLGKVVSSGALVRLTLEVEDKKGHKFLVAFHTDDRGAAFQAQCTPGNTIAVLYATQHTFAFSPPGLRLEESSHVKVFPYKLEKMLETSKEIFGKAKTGRCEVCMTVDTTMKRCAQCKSAWYCSKACQTKGWKTHKDKCTLFRDVQWFVSRNWESGSKTHAFPVERASWNGLLC
ncbi:hypothetical protein BU15DRAFT_70728 [Melanogaster broomeanus]|nr:hypothetical protein BU15DRAFT_70728 [Melanogaster broomeanus]